MNFVGQFPTYRPRRLRTSAALRRLVSETQLNASQLVLPLFVRSGRKLRRPIHAMPGVFQLSPDEILREADRAHKAGVPAILLFGIPDQKDAKASGAYAAQRHRATGRAQSEKGIPGPHGHHRRLPLRIHGARPLRHRQPSQNRRENSQRPHSQIARPNRHQPCRSRR